LTCAVPAEPHPPKRVRDAAATREALLDAARVLFAERGYDRATLREVSERAGVDAALIARYFGGKEGLYLAVFSSEPPPDVSGGPEVVATGLLKRWDEHGPGPMVQALIRRELDPAMRERMQARLDERLIGPLTAELQAAGVPRARLRAEMLVAALIGIGVVRVGNGFPDLAEVPRDELVELLAPALAALIAED
jgi:AcrR family transcriptional regulator